jgi:Hydantoinase B/oxoprolinase
VVVLLHASFDESGRALAIEAEPPAGFALRELGTAFLEEVGWGELRDGDVWIVNAPWCGGSVLAEVRLVRPVFAAGAPAGLVACAQRWPDIGALTAPEDAIELLHEGVVIPPTRLDAAARTLVLANVHDRAACEAALESQLSAVAGAGLAGQADAPAASRERTVVDLTGAPDAKPAQVNCSAALVRGAVAHALGHPPGLDVRLRPGSIYDPPRWAPVGAGPQMAMEIVESMRRRDSH